MRGNGKKGGNPRCAVEMTGVYDDQERFVNYLGLKFFQVRGAMLRPVFGYCAEEMNQLPFLVFMNSGAWAFS